MHPSVQASRSDASVKLHTNTECAVAVSSQHSRKRMARNYAFVRLFCLPTGGFTSKEQPTLCKGCKPFVKTERCVSSSCLVVWCVHVPHCSIIPCHAAAGQRAKQQCVIACQHLMRCTLRTFCTSINCVAPSLVVIFHSLVCCPFPV